ncbi:MAG: hypothetical protein ABSH06_14255 [Thermodesulfobacteriota bacterium]|jgi:hypothetical protein
MPKKRVTSGRKKSKRMSLAEALKLAEAQDNYLGLCISCFWDLDRDEQRKVEGVMVLRGTHPFMDRQWALQEQLRENLNS